MTANQLRCWTWIHQWTSLISTLFILMLCITGLPLIFHHEIDAWSKPAASSSPVNTRVTLDEILLRARAATPDKIVQYVYQDMNDDRFWQVLLGDTPDDEKNTRLVKIDAATGAVQGSERANEGFMAFMLKLHVEMLAGLPGTLLLGLMGVLLLMSIVSGVVLYAPFMRKLSFGTVRRTQSPRLKWLDLHNLLGIVTGTWLTVVALTGVINTLGEPALKLWQSGQMREMTAAYQGKPVPAKLASLQDAVVASQQREPAMKPAFIAFPGNAFSSPHHYAVFMRGDRPLKARILKPVLIDATTGVVTDSREMPWYVLAIFISQPLHFGDYGGLPMKVIWALLDVATIIVLASGVYLWIKRRHQPADAGFASVQPVQ